MERIGITIVLIVVIAIALSMYFVGRAESSEFVQVSGVAERSRNPEQRIRRRFAEVKTEPMNAMKEESLLPSSLITELVVCSQDGNALPAARVWEGGVGSRENAIVTVAPANHLGVISLSSEMLTDHKAFYVAANGYRVKLVENIEIGTKTHVELQRAEGQEILVEDESGEPISGALVRISQFPYLQFCPNNGESNMLPGADARTSIHSGLTDENGLTCIESLAPGQYILDIKHDHYCTTDESLEIMADVPGPRLRIRMHQVWAAALDMSDFVEGSTIFTKKVSDGIVSRSVPNILADTKSRLKTKFPNCKILVESPTVEWLLANPKSKRLQVNGSALGKDGFRRGISAYLQPIQELSEPSRMETKKLLSQTREFPCEVRIFDETGKIINGVDLRIQSESRKRYVVSGRTTTIEAGSYHVQTSNRLLSEFIADKPIDFKPNPSQANHEFRIDVKCEVALIKVKLRSSWGRVPFIGKLKIMQGNKSHFIMKSGGSDLIAVVPVYPNTRMSVYAGGFKPKHIEIDARRGVNNVEVELEISE